MAADDYGGGVAAAKGVPYSRLSVGVPAEHHPLEKRVATTSEVSGASHASHPPPLRRRPVLMQRDLPLSNADGGSVLEYNLVIEDY